MAKKNNKKGTQPAPSQSGYLNKAKGRSANALVLEDHHLAEAAYAAAMANPFIAPAVGVPGDGFPTYVIRRMRTVAASTLTGAGLTMEIILDNSAAIMRVVNAATAAVTWSTSVTLPAFGRVRMVAAAVRVEYTGTADQFGGTVTPYLVTRDGQGHGVPMGLAPKGNTLRFTPQCHRDRDLVLDPNQEDVPGTVVRLALTSPAAGQSLLVHFVYMIESDRPWAEAEEHTAGAYTTTHRVQTPKEGPSRIPITPGARTHHIDEVSSTPTVEGEHHSGFVSLVEEGLGILIGQKVAGAVGKRIFGGAAAQAERTAMTGAARMGAGRLIAAAAPRLLTML